ncbi:MAG: hypothetical protein AAGF75_08930 [Cyanobacteria bacterium P01_H01_bin.130]
MLNRRFPLFPTTARFPFYRGLGFSFGLLASIAIAPGSAANAHTTTIASDVAVTVHVEPEHQPAAGQPTRVWFLLTRQGGEVIPLDTAACELQVRQQPHAPDAPPLLEPEIVPINAERYQNIPGANLTFPEPGTYTLDFGCSPKQAGAFETFTIDHEAIVKAGSANTPVAAEEASPAIAPSPPLESPTDAQSAPAEISDDPFTAGTNVGYRLGYAVGAAAMVGFVLWGLKNFTRND